jgi:CheY-like chemotaxis protein
VIDVTILVADDHIDDIDGVAAALQEAGLRVAGKLPTTGVITGAVKDEAGLESVAAVEGVAAVEPAQQVQIPPPDEPVQ